MFIGFFTRLSSVVFSVCYLFGTTFEYSFGKIDHFLLPYILPLFMAFAGWGEHYSVDSRHDLKPVNAKLRVYVLAIFALTVAFSFFTSGLAKAVQGWWKWDVDGVKYHLFRSYFGPGKEASLAEYFLSIKSHLFWKASDYTVLAFELGFILSILNKKVFRAFCAFAVVFHSMNYFLLNIPFTGNLIVYLLFMEWKPVFELSKRSFKRITVTLPILATVIVVPTVYWMYLIAAGANMAKCPSLMSLVLKFIGAKDYSTDFIFVGLALVLCALILWPRKRRRKTVVSHTVA